MLVKPFITKVAEAKLKSTIEKEFIGKVTDSDNRKMLIPDAGGHMRMVDVWVNALDADEQKVLYKDLWQMVGMGCRIDLPILIYYDDMVEVLRLSSIDQIVNITNKINDEAVLKEVYSRCIIEKAFSELSVPRYAEMFRNRIRIINAEKTWKKDGVAK